MRVVSVCVAALAALTLLAPSSSSAASSSTRSRVRSGPTLHGRRAGPCDPSKWKLPIDGQYNTTSHPDPTKLNVHLIPHSHDDPGWLITVDQYYYERVQFILDTVVEELQLNPDRKFMFVEQSFFQRWWKEQSKHTKKIVKRLVKAGQLDLSVNGGWCMHDEAAPHYIAMVDQTAYGHELLKQEFNVTPRIGWQIDPFGHSSTQGSLLSAGVGFDALYFARIDYQDYGRRYDQKDLEFIWRPSKSRGKAMQVFTGQMIDHYGAPGHFHYESDTPLQDDPDMHDFNVCDQVEWFVSDAKKRGAHVKGNHIFVPMGDDFSYVDARKWYKSVDKLIHYVNQDGRINAFYSNLSYYTEQKLSEGLEWSVKTDDFFPYGTEPHEYWTGYFTSRPALKKFARVSNILLQQLRQVDAVYQSHHSAELDRLERAVGVVQHHDGISGTEKQRVSDDYALRLNEGIIDGVKELNDVLFVIGEKEKYELCLQANASICAIGNNTEKFEVYVHNALPRKTVRTISIPVSHKAAKVTPLAGNSTPQNVAIYQNLPVHPETLQELPYKVVFSAELEPLSSHRFLVQQLDTPMEDVDAKKDSFADGSNVALENDLVSVTIDPKTASIVTITNKQKKITLPVTLNVLYYLAYQGQGNGRHSGAYVFRPDSKQVFPVTNNEGDDDKITLVDVRMSPNGQNSRIAFKVGKWTTLEYILSDGDEFVEIEWTVGPIPVEDKKGKEVILRFDTKNAIASKSTWYTDSNAFEFVTRVRNHRDTWNLTLHDDAERVAANYYPIAAAVYLKDDKHQLNIATDRAQGAASLEDGQLEIMVHRRLLMDDEKGVSENLNETETFYDPLAKKTITTGLIARGSLFINVDDATDGMRSLRSKMEKEFFQPLVAFRKSTGKEEDVNAKVPWLTLNQFPENVGLTTLTELDKQSLLVRLTHLYAVDEHPSLSKPVTFDFAKYFNVKHGALTDVTELTLTATATLSETRPANNLKWKVKGEDVNEPVKLSLPLEGTTVTLQAMELRAFRITFGKQIAPLAGRDVTDKDVPVDEESTMDVLRAIEKAMNEQTAPSQLEQIVALE